MVRFRCERIWRAELAQPAGSAVSARGYLLQSRLKLPVGELVTKNYTVVLRCAGSLVRIPPDGGIRISPLKTKHGDHRLDFRQRSEELPGIATPVPRELLIEETGPAPSLAEAIAIAGRNATEYVRQLAFAANAWHGSLDVHLALDTTQGSTEREFFQNWIVDERGLPRIAREVDVHLMYRVLCAIAKLSQKDRSRFVRAVVQYTDALQHWKNGAELYALAHLYMGVEAITPLALKREIARRGLKDRKALERELDGPPAAKLGLRVATWLYAKAGGNLPNRLDPWARLEVVFKGDLETYRAAQKASNQLEHGLADHGDVHVLAVKAFKKTAEYLRLTMLDFLQLDKVDLDALAAEPYAAPIGAGGLQRQLLATIRSEADDVARLDEQYPRVRWQVDLVDYTYTSGGKGQMRLKQQLDPVVAESAAMTVERVVFAGPTPKSHTNIESDVRVGDKPLVLTTKSGAQVAIDPPGSASWAQVLGRLMLNVGTLAPMAAFWLSKLDPPGAESASKLPLPSAVEQILQVIGADPRFAARLAECKALWEEAIAMDQARSVLAGAHLGKEGLVVPGAHPTAWASLVSDPHPVRDLTTRALELSKTLATLLDELLASGAADPPLAPARESRAGM